MEPRMRVLVAAAIDVAAVAVFVALGRASHHEDQSAWFVTFWPFAVGLAAGWAVSRAWRRPFALLHAAVPAWVLTVALGMVLRGLSGQGVQPAFVLVASVVLGAFLIGWRALLVAVDRSSTRTEPGLLASMSRRRR